MTPANALTKSIITFLRLNNHYAERINNIARQVKGVFVKSQTSAGVPDIIACVNSKFVSVEVKIGKDKQSPAQKLQEEKIKKAGGQYYIAKDFNSFYLEYRKWI
jgi:Holliday junction resolvase